MPSASEQDTNQQNPFESEQPAITRILRVAPAEATPQPFSRLQEELSSLVELPYHDARKQAISAFERVYVRSLLERCKGNVSLCARTAGIDRVYLHRLLRRHGLRSAKQRSHPVKSEQAPTTEERLPK